ncbi:MAG: hypothetical protein ACPH56_12365 [Spongiibacter marinus]|uniref:hypothetical protein n=1 Tax=Spongiibacter TaxID=630749 RepID=UPI002579775E|nr:hypothetical protein [Spongiibacter sp.]
MREELAGFICPRCGHPHDPDAINPEGFTCWECPKCETEMRIHITPDRARRQRYERDGEEGS